MTKSQELNIEQKPVRGVWSRSDAPENRFWLGKKGDNNGFNKAVKTQGVGESYMQYISYMHIIYAYRIGYEIRNACRTGLLCVHGVSGVSRGRLQSAWRVGRGL